MPNRILRDGILRSPQVARLSWADEVFYRRLHSVVDDFGLYYADPGLLRADCYPRQLSKVSDSDIDKWLRACVDAGLVRVYPASDGERYLQVLKFRQQVRAAKSKFPQPQDECAADATQVHSDSDAPAHLDVSVSVSVDATPKAPKGADGRFEEFWKAYPSKVGKDVARKAFEKRKPDAELLAAMLKAIETQKLGDKWLKDGGQYIPNPATWLNQGRWQDGESGEGDSSEVGAWHETRGGVEKRAAALGMPAWDECEQWAFYRARVMAAAKEAA